MTGTGGLKRVSPSFVKNAKIPIPPLTEQRSIVSFLERETATIDAYIKQRKQEIAALQELRQAEIAAAVTRGLNPNAPMKDSEIPWMGEVPQHWEIKQLRHYLRLVSIKNKPNEQLLSVTREQGVIVRNIESKEENHNFIPEDLSNYKYVEAGRFVINKMKSWQGSYGVSKYNGIVSPAYFVCDLKHIDKDFFSIAIRSKAYVVFFNQMSKGIRVDQWDLSPIALKQIPFFEPPPAEQQQIVAYIEQCVQQIDNYIVALKQEIEQMQEYRQRLISDAVTGQFSINN
jgi:type I restriction enzyme S subunit